MFVSFTTFPIPELVTGDKIKHIAILRYLWDNVGTQLKKVYTLDHGAMEQGGLV